MRRTNQGGSIASFIIVGIILAVATAILVYVVVQRGRQARIDQATTIAVQQAKDTKAAEKAASTDAAANSSSAGTSTVNETSSTATVSNDLPHTGPHFEVGEMVGLAFLTMVSVSFVMSHRAVSRSL